VKLLVESGASPKSESRDGKIPLCLAAASEKNDVVSHLLHREHNTYALLDDKKASYNPLILMIYSSFGAKECFFVLYVPPIVGG
jgi:ankyrin repeat protein